MSIVKKLLWRTAHDDIIDDTASFAVHRSDAESYRRNLKDVPGFGGPNLYVTHIRTNSKKILDLYDMPTRSAEDKIEEVTDGDFPPNGQTPSIRIPSDIRLADRLRSMGYEWVRLTSASGVETWIWIGDWLSPNLPELKLAKKLR